MRSSIVIATLVVSTTMAHARPQGEEFERDRATLEKSLVHPAPAAGLDRAHDGAPHWCHAGKRVDEAWPTQLSGALDTYHKQNDIEVLIEAAGFTCTVDDPAYRHTATEILQDWINETGQSEADAIASLAARLDADAWSADHDKLCKALEVQGNSSDEPVAMAEARQQLFGCADMEHATHVGWMDVQAHRLEELMPYLDRGALEREHDELARLAWVDAEIANMLDPNTEAGLANYATAQFDIKALSYDAALKQLETAPYRGSRYARVVLLETIGRTKLIVARLAAAVAKRTEDKRWKELIITAPAAASAAWLAAAQKHKDALARSDKVAAQVAAHAEAAQNCEAALRPDVSSYLKAIPHGTMRELEASISDDPLAGWLLRQFSTCVELASSEHAIWKTIADLSFRVTTIGGPREAAYLATIKAGAVMRDPPFRPYYAMHAMQAEGHGEINGGDSTLLRGVIASLDKKKDGSVKVTFVKERYQYDAQECKESNKIDRIDQGKVIYRQVCHSAGKAWADKAPGPITVPAGCTMGLAKGRFMYPEFDLPAQIYTDKTAKKLVAAHCISLE